MIAEKLQSVRHRIAGACAQAGRDVNEVTLLAVSKTFGPDAVRTAFEAGQAAFGENYIQEAVDKQALLAELRDRSLEAGPSQANVIWLSVPGVDGAELAHRLERAGIIVAPGGRFGDSAHIRVTVHDAAATDRFLRALDGIAD